MAKKRQVKGISRHWTVAGITVLMLLITLAGAWSARNGTPAAQTGKQIITIGHREMITLHIAVTEGRRPGLVEVWREGGGDATLAIPERWLLRDVQGALLTDAGTGAIRNGSRTYSVPEGARLSFLLPSAENISVLNGSRAALQVKWKIIGLEKGTVKEGSVLTKDKPVMLR